MTSPGEEPTTVAVTVTSPELSPSLEPTSVDTPVPAVVAVEDSNIQVKDETERATSSRARDAFGFDPLDGSDGDQEEENADLDTEALEAILGERYLNMDISAIAAALAAAQKENDEMDCETRVLNKWKEEHADDFVSYFGSADPTMILSKISRNGDTDRSTMRRKTTLANRTLKSRTGLAGPSAGPYVC